MLILPLMNLLRDQLLAYDLVYMDETQVQVLKEEGKSPSGQGDERAGALRARQLLAEIRAWLNTSLPEVPPKSATSKALHYLNNQWLKLVRYVEDGRLPIDNNVAERVIRPFVIGRKNWLCQLCRWSRG